MCSPAHSAAVDIQSHMEKYLADAAPPSLRQSRPADYSCETAAPTVDDDKHHLSDGRLTPVAVHVHHELPPSLHSGTATLPDVKPFRAINSDGKSRHTAVKSIIFSAVFSNSSIFIVILQPFYSPNYVSCPSVRPFVRLSAGVKQSKLLLLCVAPLRGSRVSDEFV